MAKDQQWKGETRGNLLGYKIFVWSLKHIGLSFCYFLLVWVSFYFIFFSPKSSKELFNFYRKANQFSWPKALLYVWKNYFYLGQSLVDKVAIYIGLRNEFTIHKPNYDQLLSIVSTDKPCVFVVSHLGNFEAAGRLVTMPKKINLLMYEAEIQNIKNFMDSLKINSTIEAFTIKYDGSHIFHLSEAMRNNEIVCLHGDRFLEGSKTLSADFFGEKAKFPYGPFYLAERFKANVVLVSLVKTKRKEMTLEFRQLDASHGAQGILDSYSAELEKLVVKYPESWFNYHNFWQ
jgi:predicted LPLAT superfamily acyltransferase